jgi:tetratricopeptide (TPR) repeat protein
MVDSGLDLQRRLDRLSALVDMGRVDDAQREALDGVAALPQADRLWSALATLENKRADYPASVYAAERALSINPENTHAMHALGPAYFHTGRRDDARRIVDDLVATAPEWSAGLLQRACVYSWTAKNEADKQIVRSNGSSALELDPYNADTYGVVAEAHHFIGDNDEAMKLVDHGLSINPTSEKLLLMKARFGGLTEREVVELARTILAVNPRNVHALRLLHFIIWRRLIRLAAWPSIVGSLASALAYSFYLYGSADGARVWLGILLVPAAISWGSMFLFLNAVAPPNRLAETLRRTPIGLLGFVITAGANVGLIAAIVGLFLVPLRDSVALKSILDVLAVTVVALAFGDAIMRVGAARHSRRAGLFDDSPEGRLSARYAARGQWDNNLGRLGTAVIVFFAMLAAVWMPGAAALGAIACALVSTVFAKSGSHAVQRGSRLVAAAWYTLTFAAAVGAVGLAAAQLGA